jgi:membrane protein DedA with SNARE-associated domain
MYWLVRTFGTRVLGWVGLKKMLASSAFQNIDRTVDTYKAPVLIFSRFQVQATAVVNIISGLGRMKFRKFALYITIGETIQVISYGTLGYVFAESWQAVYAAVGKFSWLIALVLAVTLTLASNKIIKHMLK